jgi:phospholipase C
MSGQIDPEGLNGEPITHNAVPEGGGTWSTYAERLEQAWISWKVCQEQAVFQFNMWGQSKVFGDAGKSSPLYGKAIHSQLSL